MIYLFVSFFASVTRKTNKQKKSLWTSQTDDIYVSINVGLQKKNP